MRKKSKKIFGIVATLIVIVLCILIAIQNQDFVSKIGEVQTRPSPDPLEAKLNDAGSRYENGEISVIDISTLTTFSWDRLHIFDDYTQPSTLDSIMGSSWRKNNNCSGPVNDVSSSDSYALLVFSHKDTVVYCLAYKKYPYYLYSPIKGWDKSGYLPQEALFVISEGMMVLKEKK